MGGGGLVLVTVIDTLIGMIADIKEGHVRFGRAGCRGDYFHALAVGEFWHP